MVTVMASDDLSKSSKCTEGFLLDARSNLSELAEALCHDEIREFEGNLLHNEFELRSTCSKPPTTNPGWKGRECLN